MKVFSSTDVAAVTSVIDGVRPSGSLTTDPPRQRWFPLGSSLATAAFRNPFGDPPFAVRSTAFDSIGGLREDLVMCAHFHFLLRLSLSGLSVQVLLSPVIRKTEAYAPRLEQLTWTDLVKEKELAFQPLEDHIVDGSVQGLLSVRDWDPDRPPAMPEYCLNVVPERSAEVIARQADRSESGPSGGQRFLLWKSAKQFSLYQGNMGWSFGYRRKERGANNDEGFVAFSKTRRVTTPDGETRLEHWTEANRFPKHLAVSGSTQHPAIALRLTDKTSKHTFMSVRRWQSNFVGKLGISGVLSRGANCGDGVEFSLVLGDDILAKHILLPSDKTVKVEVTSQTNVSVGTIIEFRVDPRENDECDSTNVDFTLKGIPDRGLY